LAGPAEIASYWPMERSIGEWHDVFGKRSYLLLDLLLGYNSPSQSPGKTPGSVAGATL